MKYFAYMLYLLKHKAYVLYACSRCGILWLGIIHDWSKFRLREFFAYARFFAEHKERPSKDFSDAIWPDGISCGDPIVFAWHVHMRRNKHHWQWWVFVKSSAIRIPLSMPERYIKEMVCDWYGAARAKGTELDIWYKVNQPAMILDAPTRDKVNELLGVFVSSDGNIT